MIKHIIFEYQQEDFDNIKNIMDEKRAIEVLESLPRGWFPYSLPTFSSNVTSSDLTNYEICCAIWKAIDCLKLHYSKK